MFFCTRQNLFDIGHFVVWEYVFFLLCQLKGRRLNMWVFATQDVFLRALTTFS